MLKRYLVFVFFDRDTVEGGWADVLSETDEGDYRGPRGPGQNKTLSFDTAEDAVAVAIQANFHYFHVIDLHTGEMVASQD